MASGTQRRASAHQREEEVRALESFPAFSSVGGLKCCILSVPFSVSTPHGHGAGRSQEA